SCGWFFADIGGLEATQNIAYGLRALQMGVPPDAYRRILAGFAAVLEQAKSNKAGVNGRTILERKAAPFCAHEKILAFTAAVEKAVGFVKSDRVRLFRCDIVLRRLCETKNGRHSWHGYEAAVDNETSGEHSRWAVLVSHREMAEVRGWVVAAEDFGNKSARRRGPAAWTERSDTQRFSLMDIFKTSRENMAERIHQNSFKDTYAKYAAWMQRNEKELDFLSRLDFPLPLYCRAPLTFVYTQQWNGLLRQLERRGSEAAVAEKLRGLSGTLEQFKIAIDLKEGASLLERIIIMELSALSIKLSAETCARIECLLEIVDRFKIPVSKSAMEDTFAPIAAGPVKELRDEIIHGAAGGDEGLDGKRSLLAALVNFARRMNFNTDAYIIK
ncbi:MAG: DUF3536 domain-containing protein, partial [Chitinispirillaceae bacterium]|nr:DUF3536 domain-containing protein [Chitinispirillaceae bacterium]